MSNAVIYPCTQCGGRGALHCGACGGYGYLQESRTQYDPVRNIYTPVVERAFCYSCRGGGRMQCPSCAGAGHTKTHIGSAQRQQDSSQSVGPILTHRQSKPDQGASPAAGDRTRQEHRANVDISEAQFYCRRGYKLLGKRKFEEAIADFKQAIRLEPAYGLAYFRRGLAYELKGNRRKAIADYETVLDISDRPWLRIHTKNALKGLGVV